MWKIVTSQILHGKLLESIKNKNKNKNKLKKKKSKASVL